MVSTILLAVPALGVLALIFMFIKSSGVSKQDPGNELMQRIGKNIADGAMAFLKAEYKVLAIFVVAVAAVLVFWIWQGATPLLTLFVVTEIGGALYVVWPRKAV